MELKYKGTFKRDFETGNRSLIAAVYDSVLNVKRAASIHEIQNLKKLRKFKVHYRIRVAEKRGGFYMTYGRAGL